jgi:hypothetical protein
MPVPGAFSQGLVASISGLQDAYLTRGVWARLPPPGAAGVAPVTGTNTDRETCLRTSAEALGGISVS